MEKLWPRLNMLALAQRPRSAYSDLSHSFSLYRPPSQQITHIFFLGCCQQKVTKLKLSMQRKVGRPSNQQQCYCKQGLKKAKTRMDCGASLDWIVYLYFGQGWVSSGVFKGSVHPWENFEDLEVFYFQLEIRKLWTDTVVVFCESICKPVNFNIPWPTRASLFYCICLHRVFSNAKKLLVLCKK